MPSGYLYLNVITGGLTMLSQHRNILFDWPLYFGAPEQFPCYSSATCLERVSRRVREMAQYLRGLVVVGEDWGWAPSNHTVAHNPLSCSGEPDVFLSTDFCMHGEYINS